MLAVLKCICSPDDMLDWVIEDSYRAWPVLLRWDEGCIEFFALLVRVSSLLWSGDVREPLGSVLFRAITYRYRRHCRGREEKAVIIHMEVKDLAVGRGWQKLWGRLALTFVENVHSVLSLYKAPFLGLAKGLTSLITLNQPAWLQPMRTIRFRKERRWLFMKSKTCLLGGTDKKLWARLAWTFVENVYLVLPLYDPPFPGLAKRTYISVYSEINLLGFSRWELFVGQALLALRT